MYKPSPLWPPPPEEMTQRVHASLRSRIRETLKLDHHVHHDKDMQKPVGKIPTTSQETELPVNVGKTVSVPGLNDSDYAPLMMTTELGETLTIKGQVHVYTTNRLLAHRKFLQRIEPTLTDHCQLSSVLPCHISGDCHRCTSLQVTRRFCGTRSYIRSYVPQQSSVNTNRH